MCVCVVVCGCVIVMYQTYNQCPPHTSLTLFRKVSALLAVIWLSCRAHMKIHTHKHTQTQNPINLKRGHAARLWPPSRYLSLSISVKHATALSSSRTHSNFPKRVRSGEKQRTCSICRHQATGVKKSPAECQTARKSSWPTSGSTIRPTGRQTKWGTGGGGGAKIGLCRW